MLGDSTTRVPELTHAGGPGFPFPRGRPPPSASKRGFLCLRYRSQLFGDSQSRRRFTLPPRGPFCGRGEQNQKHTGEAQAELPEDRPNEDFRGEGQAPSSRKLQSIKYNKAFNRRRRAREIDRIGLGGCTANTEGR